MLPPSRGIFVFMLCSECRPIIRGGVNDVREVGKYTNKTLTSLVPLGTPHDYLCTRHCLGEGPTLVLPVGNQL
jgi:hypothetical protein